MNRNEYLESYKIQVVRRVMSGESHNKAAKELGVAKSTLWVESMLGNSIAE